MVRLLLVDDSSTMRRILVERLAAAELLDVESVEANNGADALELLSKQEFDLIVTDINMPKLDGMGLIRCVRGNLDASGAALETVRLTSADVPIFVLTAEGESRLEEAIQLGATGSLRKPFTSDQLSERLAMFL